MAVTEIVQLAVQGGFAVILVLVGYGGYRLARDHLPRFMAFLERLNASQAEHAAKQAALDSKVDIVVASVQRLGDTASSAITKAGDAAAGALGKLGDVVSAEGFETRSALADAERRLTAAVRREQTSDPPPRSSLNPAANVRRVMP